MSIEALNTFIHSKYGRLLRFDKPTGFYLLLLPVWWAVSLASHSPGQAILYLVIFSIGGVLMRSAGCIINDLTDKDIDPLVARTASRPIASGEVSVKEALKILSLLLIVALIILLTLPFKAIAIGIFAVIPIIIYPRMKRVTYFPQIFLGFTFNLGVLIAWFSIAKHTASLLPFILYLASVFWTVGFDTIYGIQDKDDDIKVGIKSPIIKYGESTIYFVWVLYKLMGVLLALCGLFTHMNIFYYIGIAIAFYYLYLQVETLDLEHPEDCATKFKSNIRVGLLICAAIIVGRI